jgi:putative protein-disulfide isomerase
MKKKIYYIYDALCGWCYGFSPVIKKFYEENSKHFEVEVLSGGMVRGARVGPVAEVAPYIKTAYKQVENASGVVFGEKFLGMLDEGNAIFDSIPAAKAMAIVKRMQPNQQLEFAHRLQKAIYFEGMQPRDRDGMAKLASTLGIEKEYFLKAIETDEAGHHAAQEFAHIENWGIQGFPAVVIDRGDQLYLAARGFTPYEQFKETIKSILEKEPG